MGFMELGYQRREHRRAEELTQCTAGCQVLASGYAKHSHSLDDVHKVTGPHLLLCCEPACEEAQPRMPSGSSVLVALAAAVTHGMGEQGQRRSARAPKRSRQHEDYTDNEEEGSAEPETEEPELSSDRAEQVVVSQLVKCA